MTSKLIVESSDVVEKQKYEFALLGQSGDDLMLSTLGIVHIANFSLIAQKVLQLFKLEARRGEQRLAMPFVRLF